MALLRLLIKTNYLVIQGRNMPCFKAAHVLRAIASISALLFISNTSGASEITHLLHMHRQLEGDVRSKIICDAGIDLEGSLKPGDAKRLASVFRELQAERLKNDCGDRSIFVELDSDGGLVEEALALGRFIRRNGLATRVGFGKSCNSSCVFVFASGVTRIAYSGNVGIHRPYFAALSTHLSYQQVQERRLAMIASLKAFAREMDFSEKLIDDMLAIEPSDIKIITSRENSEYRIWSDDATWEEQKVAKFAEAFGIDSLTFRRRKATVEKLCGEPPTGPDGDAYSNCYLSIMADISHEKATLYRKRFYKECKPEDTGCAKRILGAIR